MKMKKVLRAVFCLVFLLSTVMLAYNDQHVSATSISPKMNGKILYTSAQSSGFEIYVMNPDGTGNTQLTNTPGAVINSHASWSPNGKKIVFSSDRDVSNSEEIYIMDADGSNQTRITNNAYRDEEPKWSPNGDKIAFLSDRTGDYDLYLMNIDGTNQVDITNDPGLDRFPVWSPDGSKIAWSSSRTGREQIYVYDVVNQTTTQITYNSSSDQTEPNWSPDGSKIIMASSQNSNALRLYTMNPDGSNQTLVNFTCPNTAVTFNIFEGYPTYSPDGKKILASSNCYTESVTNNAGFILMNADGSNPVDFTKNPTWGWYDSEWMDLPVSASTDNPDGTTTEEIDDDKSDVDYDVWNKIVFVVNGKAGQVNVHSNGILKGHGTIVVGVTVESGGKLAPGNSPGCINTGDLVFNSGSTYEAEIAGTTACSQYDRTNVTGAVTLGNAKLSTLLLNGFKGSQGDKFNIINNDGADSVSGTFNNLPEGSTFTVGSTVFKISYVGGDGNDVVLTVQNVPTSPNTGVGLITANPIPVLAASVAASGLLLLIARSFRRSTHG